MIRIVSACWHWAVMVQLLQLKLLSLPFYTLFSGQINSTGVVPAVPLLLLLSGCVHLSFTGFIPVTLDVYNYI